MSEHSAELAALTDDEREALCICAELSSLLSHDQVKATCLGRERAVQRIIAARIAALAAEVSDMAAIGQTSYSDLTAEQVQKFREHPLGAAFGDVADIPEGRDAVIAWLSTPPATERS